MVVLAVFFLAGIGFVQSDALERAAPQAVLSASSFVVPYYSPPMQLSLCGEPVPLHDQDVWERFDREFTIIVHSRAQVYLWLKRMERYFPSIESQLQQNRLPDDLKYVAVAESDLMQSANSPAGAAGPWQFISSTGRNYGLMQTPAIDERYDFGMATESAFRYLNDLHCMFRNWALALAAYNCGENRVKDEISRQKATNYYQLKLPLETERYIFRILAIKAVLENPEQYGYHLPAGAGYPERTVDRVNVQLLNPLPIQLVAEAAEITYREFKLLNPAFISDSIPAGAFMIATPKGKGRILESRLASIEEQARSEVKPLSHTVRKGETLSTVAALYKVRVKDILNWNDLKDGNTVQPGQNLKIMAP